jgi:WD40 repeat protein
MPDVFISYSRDDLDFVRRLHAALEARGKDVWTDWEDIRKGAEWWAKVKGGIESAAVIVPVLSPAFAVSEVCDDEIAYALTRNKRLLPIMVDEPDGDLRAELRAPNWVLFRDSDDFAEALDQLVEAVETDLHWVDQHARLLVRAVEWEDRDRDGSLLLRGSDLDAAEDWLRRQSGHREEPTALHTEYVLESRRAETGRQRRLLAGVTIALVLAVGLAALALVLRNQAIEREHVATSRLLAAHAMAQLRIDPEASLLLALRAADEAHTDQAELALRRALADSHVRSVRRLKPRRPDAAVFSPSGKWALLVARNGLASAFEVATGRTHMLSGRRKINDDSFGDDFANRNGLAFAPDGKVAAIANVDGSVTAWETGSWKRLAHWRGNISDVYLPGPTSLVVTIEDLGHAQVRSFPSGRVIADLGRDVFHAEIASDGRAIATATGAEIDDVRLWFGPRWKRSRLLRYQANPQFSPDGRLLVTNGQGRAGTFVWDARTGKLLRAFGTGCRCWRGVFSSDGRRVVTESGSDRATVVWGTRNWRRIRVLEKEAEESVAAVSRDGRFVVHASDQGTPSVHDLASGRRVAWLRGHTGRLLNAFAGATGTVTTISSDGTIRRWEQPAWTTETAIRGDVEGAAFAHDWIVAIASTGTTSSGRRLFGRGRSRIWRASVSARGRILHRRSYPLPDLVFPEVSPDGRYAAFPEAEVATELWDLRTDPPRRVKTLNGAGTAVFSRDGKFLATGSGESRTVRVYATGSWAPRGRLARASDASLIEPALAVAAGGERVFAAPFQADAAIWDARTRDRLANLGHMPAVYDSSFSADGSRIVIGPEAEPLRIHDARTGEVITELLGHTSQAGTVDFSPDGKLVLSAAEDGSVRLWDAATGQPVAELFALPASLSGAAFDARGRRILAWGEGSIRTYFCEICASWDELRAMAAERVTRELSAAELERYGAD